MSPTITTKADLRKAYPFGLLKVDKSRLATYHESSGTEGSPISSYFTHADWQDIASRFLRSSVGLNAKDIFFIKTPYSMVTTAHQAQKAAELAGCLVVPGDNRTTLMPYSRVVQILKDLEVTVTWSLPSEVLFWGLAANALGYDPKKDFPALRAFWVAGEALSPARKKILQTLWGGKAVIEDYGSTETGSLAGECRHGRLHAWSDRLRFEIYHPDSGDISSFGRGQLLVTSLYREAMPLTRYLIEDEVLLDSNACECGSPLPTIRVFGRRSSEMAIQGNRFLPLDIEEAVCNAGLPYGLTLWKGFYDETSLEIRFASTENDAACREAVQSGVANLGISCRAKSYPISEFITGNLFTEKLQFSKPSYLFRRTP